MLHTKQVKCFGDLERETESQTAPRKYIMRSDHEKRHTSHMGRRLFGGLVLWIVISSILKFTAILPAGGRGVSQRKFLTHLSNGAGPPLQWT